MNEIIVMIMMWKKGVTNKLRQIRNGWDDDD
jgi:hypothetical protein